MISESNEIMAGFDLGSEFSQLTYYCQNNNEPTTVSTVTGEKKYQISTPKDLFPFVEQGAELGIALLSNFFKQCLEELAGVKTMKKVSIMVTMKTMKSVWARVIRLALDMLDIPREQVFLQDHQESFFYYLLNQKKEFWTGSAALFEYEKGEINAYELCIDYHTKPAFVHVDKVSRLYLDTKARKGLSDDQWIKTKDELFLNQCKKMFQDKNFTSVFLVGEKFDKIWTQKSLNFLCQKRHVFQGENLFSKGACYGAMDKEGVAPLGDYLFAGPDMIEQNISMPMIVKGKEIQYHLISAGVSWFMARHECEFILDNTEEIRLYSKSMSSEEMQHSILLTDLPDRPNRATRIRMEIEFTSVNKCRICMDDLGLGKLYPSMGKKWESVIEFSERK